ncbi:MAG: DEAD/DEAH box helicase family protein [Desulfobacterales bacterium]|nr:DEAD/DEAH box helicase family protein [Desulfobacterales bacterium]
MTPEVFFDITPHPFQERILEALERERAVHNRFRNLVIAATGTGKTVVAAFDFSDGFLTRKRTRPDYFLLHIAKRYCIRHWQPSETSCVTVTSGSYWLARTRQIGWSTSFCSVMLTSRRLWEQVGMQFYDYIVVDEVHHGTADSYRPYIRSLHPSSSPFVQPSLNEWNGDVIMKMAADFDNRFAAEIRLPEALEAAL